MLNYFSLFEAIRDKTKRRLSDGDAKDPSNSHLNKEHLVGAYLGLGSACEVFEENGMRLQQSDL